MRTTRRYTVAATPVVLLLISLALLLVVLALVPHRSADPPLQRPARPTVIAAIQRHKLEAINGRIAGLSRAGFVIRTLLGTRTVVVLRRTIYVGSNSMPLPRASLRKGDRIIANGYQASGELLATRVRDTSRSA
jgi:hypothetical protein